MYLRTIGVILRIVPHPSSSRRGGLTNFSARRNVAICKISDLTGERGLVANMSVPKEQE